MNRTIITRILVSSLALNVLWAVQAEPAGPAPSSREARLAWWHEAKFGMFIHWGLYSLPGGEWKGQAYPGIGEWIMFKARIPVGEYEQLARQFNPVQFDAEAWAQLAQDAGMKYLVITSKHHDGFAMFGSKADPFNIVDATPFQRDPMKELASACARRGIRFGFYYSQAQDWTAPGGAIWKGRHEDGPDFGGKRWDPRQEGDFDAYLTRKAVPQVQELLRNYGPVSIIWFDTPLDVMTQERASRFERAVRDLQPDCLISGRLGGESQSDYESEGDNRIPDLSRTGAWETPATLNDTWGFKKDDHNWKKSEDLIFKLVDIVSKGGNYLLNVGPDAEGVIPQPSQDMLRVVGRWLKVNGESIYGAGRSPFGDEFGAFHATKTDKNGNPRFEPRQAWRCTTKPGKLYLHLFQWPDGKFELTGVKGQAKRAYLLADPNRTPLIATQNDEHLSIALPMNAPDAIASVVCVELGRDSRRGAEPGE